MTGRGEREALLLRVQPLIAFWTLAATLVLPPSYVLGTLEEAAEEVEKEFNKCKL